MIINNKVKILSFVSATKSEVNKDDFNAIRKAKKKFSCEIEINKLF